MSKELILTATKKSARHTIVRLIDDLHLALDYLAAGEDLTAFGECSDIRAISRRSQGCDLSASATVTCGKRSSPRPTTPPEIPSAAEHTL